MKRKALSLAVAASCAASGAALAYDPDGPATDYEIRIAGATGPTNTLRDVIIDSVCTSDIHYFKHATNKHWNVACNVGGDNVLFRKNDGGSGTGTSPVDNASTPVEFFDGGLSTSGCSTSAATTGSTAYTSVTGCGTSGGDGGEGLIDYVADIGISDVEPGAFKGALAPLLDPTNANTANSFQNESNMDVRTLAGLGFGIVVSENLYQALQADQFAGTTLAADCTPSGANYSTAASDAVPKDLVNHKMGDTEMCMPNLASHTVRSILSESIQTWDQLKTGDGSTSLLEDALFESYGTFNPTVKVCRRIQGSGTHARTAITFLRTNCGSGSIVMGQPACNTKIDGADCGDGFEGAQGSGEMTDCMNASNNNGKWAIGYHSVEKNAELSHPYRFVKIDGFAPTLENMLSGNYANFGEVTMQKRTTRTGVALAGGYDYAGAQANAADLDAIFEAIVTAMSGPAAAESLNDSSKFLHPFGNAGWAARPNPNAVPAVNPYPQTIVGGIYTLPVNPLTHVNPTSNQQNTCYGPYAPAGTLVD